MKNKKVGVYFLVAVLLVAGSNLHGMLDGIKANKVALGSSFFAAAVSMGLIKYSNSSTNKEVAENSRRIRKLEEDESKKLMAWLKGDDAKTLLAKLLAQEVKKQIEAQNSNFTGDALLKVGSLLTEKMRPIKEQQEAYQSTLENDINEKLRALSETINQGLLGEIKQQIEAQKWGAQFDALRQKNAETIKEQQEAYQSTLKEQNRRLKEVEAKLDSFKDVAMVVAWMKVAKGEITELRREKRVRGEGGDQPVPVEKKQESESLFDTRIQENESNILLLQAAYKKNTKQFSFLGKGTSLHDELHKRKKRFRNLRSTVKENKTALEGILARLTDEKKHEREWSTISNVSLTVSSDDEDREEEGEDEV